MALVCFHAIPEYLELLLLTFCVGVPISLLWVFRNPPTLNVSPSDRAWRLLRLGSLAMAVISFANLLVRIAEMSGQPFTSVFSLLPDVIAGTHLGHVWLIRMAAILLMSVMANAGKRFRGSPSFLSLMLGIGLVVSMTWSATGHAADSGDFSLPEIMDWLHLLSVLFWGGGLFVIYLTAIPDMARTDGQSARYMAEAAARFSRIAGSAVAVIALTAIYNAVVYVGSLDAFVEAPYGRIVIAKAALFFLLLNLGASNRYVNIPFLWQQTGCTEAERGFVASAVSRCFAPLSRRLKEGRLSLRFESIIRAEAFLITLVLLCAVMLRHEVPGRHFLHRDVDPHIKWTRIS
ncbi:MAG TPA: CopD family protein [Geobacteraceae bacterium]|nr:CopD family protein [Geobacteraceae bacterium]